MKCQKCDNPATLHVTEVAEGKPVQIQLCETHAREFLSGAQGGEFEGFPGMPAEQKSMMTLFSDPEITRILSGGESRQRMSAYLLPTLCVALTDDDPGVRVLAALGMLFLRDHAHSALPALHDALSDDDSRVRKVAEVAVQCIEAADAGSIDSL